jgi:hypothetical protein
MGELHQLVLAFGRERAQELAGPEVETRLLDIASRVLSEESQAIGITYAGFCLTSLPHKRLPDTQPWRRTSRRVTLLIEPGRLTDSDQLYGVPFGSRARLILIYLQTMALRTNSPEIELGRSMRDWMARMNVSLGGKSYRDVREQANRISACRLTFSWDEGRDTAFIRDSVVAGGLSSFDTFDGSRSEERALRAVRLSQTFFDQLRKHPVPIWEPALRYIANQSMAIDTYIWLSYRLHSLSAPTPITWKALHSQFGVGFKRLDQFRTYFTAAVRTATMVYPDAKIDITPKGMVLYPSAPPIMPRSLVAVPKWDLISPHSYPAVRSR